jgi:phosphoribosylformylglycinamidine cyclo-ligase
LKPNARDAYALAGVDIRLADKVKRTIARQAKTTLGPSVLGGPGFFGGMFRLKGYRKPVLVSSADGVGTKLKIAALLNRYDTVGIDLVNHCVNDILCCGAKPLFFLDYIAMEKIKPKQIKEIISGIIKACQAVNCCLIGGETAQMPGIYSKGNYDLVGFIVGVVEEKDIIDSSSITAGDALLGLPSSGLHTNGFSLVRKVFALDSSPSHLNKFYPQLGKTLGEELLQVHHCYYHELKPVLHLIKGLAHITGGSFEGNIPRILPQKLAAYIRKHSWEVPAIFKLIQEKGKLDEAEMYRVFNMGIGMVLICSTEHLSQLTTFLPHAKLIGEVIKPKDGQRVIIH